MKRKITPKSVVLAMLLTSAFLSNAQDKPRSFGKYPLETNINGVVPCASYEYEMMLQEKNPKRATEQQFEAWMSQMLKEKREKGIQKAGPTVITIPVVVHVIYQGSDEPGQNENISLAQIQSQINVLNQDYRKIAGTPGDDQTGYGVDTMIQFKLATKDIDGLTFDGVDRYQQSVVQFTSQDQVESIKSNTIWNPEQYLNIWTLNWGGPISDLLGYAQFPSQPGLPDLSGMGGDIYTDGVAINYKNFGTSNEVDNPNFSGAYQYGRTATHEIGHFLGLRHIWGDVTGCEGDDHCDDTPTQNDKSQGCPAIGTDTCQQGLPDLFQDYMDYSNDACMSVFTQDQMDRMRIILANSPRRKTLATSPALSTEEVQLLQGMKVYPNPAQNVLNITVDNGDLPDAYVIYNSIGQLVANAKVNTEANLTIDTSAYSNGMYFIKIDKGNESKTIKFIKN